MRNMHSSRAPHFRMVINRTNFLIVPMIRQPRTMCNLRRRRMHKLMAMLKLHTQVAPRVQYLQVKLLSPSQRQLHQHLILHSTQNHINIHSTAKSPLLSQHTSLAQIPIILLSITATRCRISMTPNSSRTWHHNFSALQTTWPTLSSQLTSMLTPCFRWDKAGMRRLLRRCGHNQYKLTCNSSNITRIRACSRFFGNGVSEEKVWKGMMWEYSVWRREGERSNFILGVRI